MNRSIPAYRSVPPPIPHDYAVLVASPEQAVRVQFTRALAPLVSQGAITQLLEADQEQAVRHHLQTAALDLLLLDTPFHALLSDFASETLPPWVAIVPPLPPAPERALALGAVDVFAPPLSDALIATRVLRLLTQQTTMHALSESETRWRQAFENSRAPQLIIDSDTSAIVDANRAACTFYGYRREVFLTLTLSALEASEEGSALSGTLFNYRQRLASGEICDVKLFPTAITYRGRRAIHQIVQDNSKRRRAEQSEHTQRTLATALRNTANILLTTFDRDALFDGILSYVASNMQRASMNIKLIEHGVARIVRARGYQTTDQVEQFRFQVDEMPLMREMVQTGRHVLVPDTEHEPRWIDDPRWHWIRAHVSAPIQIDGEVIGFLALDSGVPNAYTEADADHLRAMADQAAIAIRNLRLYEQIREVASHLEVRVSQRTAELYSEREQLGAILNSMTEGVILTEFTPAGRPIIRYVNRVMSEMMGCAPDYFFSRGIHLFQPANETPQRYRRALREVARLLQTERVITIETVLNRTDGQPFDVNITLTRVDGTPDIETPPHVGSPVRAVVTVIRDISREKALQDERSRFVAFASHELRTPITNIKTRLYLLRRQPEKMDEHIDIMSEVTDRMKKLVDDLLDVNRFERGSIELQRVETALYVLLQAVIETQQPEAERMGIRLNVSYTAEPLPVLIDVERIAQAITSLITNAINYTPEGGEVRVQLRHSAPHERPPCALVIVEDTGVGIAPEHIDHIFQPFYRVASSVAGTGLGLTVAREIVALHGGDIAAHSEPGLGSRFIIRLPLVSMPQPSRLFHSPTSTR